MDDWEITPFLSVGPLVLGTPRAQIRAQLGDEFKEFKKVPWAQNTTMAYRALGLHLGFDEEDQLSAVEAFLPCNPTFNNIAFVGQNSGDIIRKMMALGQPAVQSAAGVSFDAIGIGLYCDDGKIVSGVAVFSRKEYEKIVELRRSSEQRRKARAQKGVRREDLGL